ncbi:hypothetical protein [Thermasporomyces composti]|nr:hypothetical protein [Thermasporomyces composti]
MSFSTMRRLTLVGAAFALLSSGCGTVEEAVGQVSAEAAARAIGGTVGRLLADHGIRLDGKPRCSADMSVVEGDAALDGTVRCTGRTSTGQDIEATFDGSVSTTSCTGSLIVTVGGRQIIQTPDLPACELASG